jgi:hypothetical protein
MMVSSLVTGQCDNEERLQPLLASGFTVMQVKVTTLQRYGSSTRATKIPDIFLAGAAAKKMIARHPAAHKVTRYRCFLPDLAGFASLCCTGPGYQTEFPGGEGGIRTLGTFPYTRFPVVHLRPLGHLSIIY